MNYSGKVATLLMRHYGLELNDCFEQAELDEYENSGQQPYEVVNIIADKRDLDRLDTTAYMSSSRSLVELDQYFGKGKKRTPKAAPVRDAEVVLTPAQLDDLSRYVVRHGKPRSHFEPADVTANANGFLHRDDESESWIIVWMAQGWPVAVSDVFNFDGFILNISSDLVS